MHDDIAEEKEYEPSPRRPHGGSLARQRRRHVEQATMSESPSSHFGDSDLGDDDYQSSDRRGRISRQNSGSRLQSRHRQESNSARNHMSPPVRSNSRSHSPLPSSPSNSKQLPRSYSRSQPNSPEGNPSRRMSNSSSNQSSEMHSRRGSGASGVMASHHGRRNSGVSMGRRSSGRTHSHHGSDGVRGERTTPRERSSAQAQREGETRVSTAHPHSNPHITTSCPSVASNASTYVL